MTHERLVRGVDGSTAIGVALDQRTEKPTVSIWIQGTGHPVQGTNLSATAARALAERLSQTAARAE